MNNTAPETMHKYASDRQLAVRYGVDRGTIWRWVRERDFPQPVKMSEKCTRWRLANVEDWEVKHGFAA